MRFLFILLLIAGSFAFSSPVSAQVVAQLSPQERARLEAELEQIQREIEQKEAELAAQRANSASLGRDVTILTQEIEKAKLLIKEKNNLISSLGSEINLRERTIKELNEKLEREQRSLEQILRQKHELEEVTMAEFLLSGEGVSDFFIDLDSFASVNRALQDSFDVIREIQGKTKTEKEKLEEKKKREADVKYELEKNKKQVEVKQGEKKTLLTVSKNQEKSYEQIIADRKAKASQIRARLFELRGQGAIPFGDAYQYAKVAAARTGVRPAFILAILTQESSLGANVGTCNRPGDARTWRDIMPGGAKTGSSRDDQAAFLRVVGRLGLQPEGQPLSCPAPWGGWGGAMGPSQFIPTTWEMYDQRIEKALGVDVADPWNPGHAITATALYVADLGAGAKTYTSEREAACRYYSGVGCSNPKVKNAFYGNAVMAHALKIQAEIDELEDLER